MTLIILFNSKLLIPISCLRLPKSYMPKVWQCVQIKDRLAHSPKGVSTGTKKVPQIFRPEEPTVIITQKTVQPHGMLPVPITKLRQLYVHRTNQISVVRLSDENYERLLWMR